MLGHSARRQQPASWTPESIETAFQQTKEYWEQWSRACTYEDDHRDQVLRSALTLKLLTFEPTGAIIAAPTFSAGGEWRRAQTGTIVLRGCATPASP